MKKFLSLFCVLFCANVLAVTTTSHQQESNVAINLKFINNNVQIVIDNGTRTPLVIHQINEYTNNGVACAISNSSYLIKGSSSLNLYPFTVIDMANCFSKVHLFKIYSNGAFPHPIGFYDSTKVFKSDDYLTDWGAYVLTPTAFTIRYTHDNIEYQLALVRYFAYKINE